MIKLNKIIKQKENYVKTRFNVTILVKLHKTSIDVILVITLLF